MSLDVHPIVDELTQARHSSGSMNAATMTFVLFFDNPATAEWVSQRTRKVADKHPSRVVLFDATKPPGDQHAEPSTTRGEWVEVGVNGSSPDEVSAALSMLALPEAPIVLLWVAEHLASDERFLALGKMAHTVVVNTALSSVDATAMRDLIAFVEAHPEIWVQDLAYIRLAAWQELIAEFFDDAAHLSELLTLREVDVAAGSDSEMYYLLGWMASRLGWRPSKGGVFTDAMDQPVRFTVAREGAARRVARVTLKSATATYTAEVHPADQGAVCLSAENGDERVERCAPLHTMDIASMIERAILTGRRDEVFTQSLAMAKAILERP